MPGVFLLAFLFYKIINIRGVVIMAGTMVHLVIADMLVQKWGGKEVVTPYGNINVADSYFIAGNICPDGIMARRNYTRDMKKHTHFRDGIDDCDFHKKENLALFQQRLSDFIKENLGLVKTDNERSLYLGYWTHMLADEFFMLEIRPVFLKNISVKGLTEYNMETFKYFSKDVDMIDFRLVNEYGGVKRIYNTLSGISPYSINGMVTEEELTDSRNWILNYFFETEHNSTVPPVYISYKEVQDFISDTVSKIAEKVAVK